MNLCTLNIAGGQWHICDMPAMTKSTFQSHKLE